ncbi:tetratricopeptide repeat protein [Propionivibrio sp.]|uniref:tetratricopeptide repeat protein n=1 Tax=Propionivibrio sp. TaxID=2212460 RepID=UPI003430A0AD
MRSFREALRVTPYSPDVYFCLGNLQRERGDLDAALSSYRSCLDALPGFAPAYNNLGNEMLKPPRPERECGA